MKILMIGLGGIGQRHTRILRTLLGDAPEIVAYRVRRQMHVVTPAMDADTSRNVEDIYSIRVLSSLMRLRGKAGHRLCVQSQQSARSGYVGLHRRPMRCLRRKPLADSMNGVERLVRVAAEQSELPWSATSYVSIRACETGRHGAEWRPRQSAGCPRHDRRISSQLASL